MIVCLCNGLTEEEVGDAVRSGCRSVREIFAACGCLKQCGKCEREMAAILRSGRPAEGAAGDRRAVPRS